MKKGLMFWLQLQKLVVENILAFNESFWIRLAARTDTCKSDDDKAWFPTWSIFCLLFKVFMISAHNGFYLLCLKMLILVWCFTERLRGAGIISYEHSRPPCSQDQCESLSLSLTHACTCTLSDEGFSTVFVINLS